MAESSDKLYRVEYAKSGRASCKKCSESIPKDSLRMAIMVQVRAAALCAAGVEGEGRRGRGRGRPREPAKAREVRLGALLQGGGCFLPHCLLGVGAEARVGFRSRPGSDLPRAGRFLSYIDDGDGRLRVLFFFF